MLTEVDAEQSRSVAVERTSEWLERIEASVESAHAALLGPQRSDLLQFTSEIESACRERFCLAATPAMTPRLAALRKRLTLLRAMLRQATLFAEARELETECVLGYTPRGLERAL